MDDIRLVAGIIAVVKVLLEAVRIWLEIQMEVVEMSKVYQIVTDKIIKKLEQPTIPWRQPSTDSAAVKWKKQKQYRGSEVF